MVKKLNNSNQLAPKATKARARSKLSMHQCEVIRLFGSISFEPGFNYKVERAKR